MVYDLNRLILRSQILSLASALGIIFVILIILFRSFKGGLVGLIPVTAALAGMFLVMIAAGFKLDIVTSLLASLAVGIGVDYSIHFISAYKKQLLAGNPDPLASVYRSTGRAIFFNAVSVGAGFLTLVFSRFIPIRAMGLLFPVAMLSACFASLVILPAVLESVSPDFLIKQKKRNGGAL